MDKLYLMEKQLLMLHEELRKVKSFFKVRINYIYLYILLGILKKL
jgi:hypothetical protein